MSVVNLLPSKQFSLIAISLLISGGIVFAADYITKPSATGSLAVSVTENQAPAVTNDWQASLTAVQEHSGISLPAAPDQNTIDALLQAAQSNNLTQSVSRNLFVNLVNAKGQGLGSDIPTQEQIITGALSQVPTSSSGKKTYSVEDLTLAENSSASLHAYGNAVMAILVKNSDNEYAKTLVIIDAATTQNDANQLALFGPIQKKYQLIANELANIPVPKILGPFHLELLNDYANITASYAGMGALISDPLNGVAAIQQYRSLAQDAGQMFINIAQTLNKNDILFNKNEPGATWAILLQSQ